MKGTLNVKTQTGSSDTGPPEYGRNNGRTHFSLGPAGVEDLFSEIQQLYSCLYRGRCLELLIAFLSSLSFNYIKEISVGGDL